jgi:hypothetical protein
MYLIKFLFGKVGREVRNEMIPEIKERRKRESKEMRERMEDNREIRNDIEINKK